MPDTQSTTADAYAAAFWEHIETLSPLQAVLQANHAARVAQTYTEWYVREAHLAGHSWADIGIALGISRQAAWERFHLFAGDRNDVNGRPLYDEAGDVLF